MNTWLGHLSDFGVGMLWVVPGQFCFGRQRGRLLRMAISRDFEGRERTSRTPASSIALAVAGLSQNGHRACAAAARGSRGRSGSRREKSAVWTAPVLNATPCVAVEDPIAPRAPQPAWRSRRDVRNGDQVSCSRAKSSILLDQLDQAGLNDGTGRWPRKRVGDGTSRHVGQDRTC